LISKSLVLKSFLFIHRHKIHESSLDMSSRTYGMNEANKRATNYRFKFVVCFHNIPLIAIYYDYLAVLHLKFISHLIFEMITLILRKFTAVLFILYRWDKPCCFLSPYGSVILIDFVVLHYGGNAKHVHRASHSNIL